MKDSKLAFIIENSDVDRLLTEKYVKEYDFEIMSFSNPVDALSSLDIHKPSLIVLDYTMKEINAAEFMIKISERLLHGQWQVYLVTSEEFSEEEKTSMLTLGITHILKKPIQKKLIQEALSKFSL
jgi:CheY-like chemotaxis protein